MSMDDLLSRLADSNSSEECLRVAEQLSQLILINLPLFYDVNGKLAEMCMDKKSGVLRESGFIGFYGLAKTCKLAGLPFLIPMLPLLFEGLSDKGQPVKDAAQLAIDSVLASISPIHFSLLLPVLFDAMTKKWQTKICALESLAAFTNTSAPYIGRYLVKIIPAVTECMHDTKPQVSQAAVDCMTKLCSVVQNPDIERHVPLLVDCMLHPDNVTNTIQSIASTTFVAEVTGPALSLMVPLLVRALNNRSSSLLRPTVVIADNLFRLVKNPADAGQFMPQILPGLDVIIDTAGPEIRSLATAAKNTLVKSAAGAKNVLKVSSQDSLKIIKRLTSDRKLFLGTFYDESFLLVAQIISLLVTEEIYQKSMWKEAIAPMIQPILHDDCEPILDSLFAHFYNVYKVIQFDIEVATSRRAR